MSVYDGDFLGFQLGDTHSSQLNITRVSSGDRYTENLTPNFKDISEQVPGADGTYYWDTYYTDRTFVIDFAFDDLRNEDIRRLKQILNFKGVQPLIFDESTYKKYYVKCSSPPVLKYIGFDNKGTILYKGEGNINLIAYYPYGVSTIDIKIDGGTNLQLSNIGDIETPMKIYYSLDELVDYDLSLWLSEDKKLDITIEDKIKKNEEAESRDSYICIDNKTHLIEGLDDNYKKTGNLYNRFITSGDFFSLPVGRSTFNTNKSCDKIEYNYLYY